MPLPYNLLDSTGAFLANIILKNGRNEVQIYHFHPSSSTSDSITDDSKTKRYETDHAITCATWLNETHSDKIPRKTNKRKAYSDDGSVSSHTKAGSEPSALLAVAFASGEVCLYSPYSDGPVSSISAPSTVISLTQASAENCFWALTDTQTILEIETSKGAVNREINFSKVDKKVQSLFLSLYKPKSLSHKSQDTELLLVASSRVHLVNGAKSKNHVLAELPSIDEEDSTGIVSTLRTMAFDELAILVSWENSNVVALYDLDEPSQKPSAWKCKSHRITNVRALTENLVAVFTDAGTEILTIKDNALNGRVAVVKTNYKRIAFADMIWNESRGVIGIWYDGNEPRFVKISSDPIFDGTVKVKINFQPVAEGPVEEDVPDITFVAEDDASESGKVEKIAPSNLSPLLRDLLLEPSNNRKEILTVCSKNNDDDTIKEAIRLFSQSEQCETIVQNLFQLVSREVSRDPTRKSPLAIWLKWILLAHGGYISKQAEQEEHLRALKESLVQGMEMMPKLLALQGRLQLLKSQADLRNKTGNISLEDEEDGFNGLDQDTGIDTTNNTAFEDLVMYVNGENDDFEGEGDNGTLYENGEAEQDEEE